MDVHYVVRLHEVLGGVHVARVVLDSDNEPLLQRLVPEVVRVHGEVARIRPMI